MVMSFWEIEGRRPAAMAMVSATPKSGLYTESSLPRLSDLPDPKAF
jgi:hypothetical protein